MILKVKCFLKFEVHPSQRLQVFSANPAEKKRLISQVASNVLS